jgi:hypothetical protein
MREQPTKLDLGRRWFRAYVRGEVPSGVRSTTLGSVAMLYVRFGVLFAENGGEVVETRKLWVRACGWARSSQSLMAHGTSIACQRRVGFGRRIQSKWWSQSKCVAPGLGNEGRASRRICAVLRSESRKLLVAGDKYPGLCIYKESPEEQMHWERLLDWSDGPRRRAA